MLWMLRRPWGLLAVGLIALFIGLGSSWESSPTCGGRSMRPSDVCVKDGVESTYDQMADDRRSDGAFATVAGVIFTTAGVLWLLASWWRTRAAKAAKAAASARRAAALRPPGPVGSGPPTVPGGGSPWTPSVPSVLGDAPVLPDAGFGAAPPAVRPWPPVDPSDGADGATDVTGFDAPKG